VVAARPEGRRRRAPRDVRAVVPHWSKSTGRTRQSSTHPHRSNYGRSADDGAESMQVSAAVRCSLLHVQRRQLPHPLAQLLKLMSIHHGASPPLNTNASHSITDRTAAHCTPHNAGAGSARQPRERRNRSLNRKSGGCHSSGCRAARSAAYCSGACDAAHSPSKDALHVWRRRLKHQKNDYVVEQDSGIAPEFVLLQATRLA